MCKRTKVLYSCGCFATVAEFCTLVENDPAASCPNVRIFTGSDQSICPSCGDKVEDRQRKNRRREVREQRRREREQRAREEETARDLINAQAFEAGYNNERRRQEVGTQAFAAGYEYERERQASAGTSYGAGYGYATANSYDAAYGESYRTPAAEDAEEAEMQYVQNVIAENQRMGQGRSSRERRR